MKILFMYILERIATYNDRKYLFENPITRNPMNNEYIREYTELNE